MNATAKLGVYRRLDNRLEGLSDDSPRALELHNRRRDALREALDTAVGIEVQDWGKTDDTQPHEFVELAVAAIGPAALKYAVVPGLKWLGKKLAEKAVDTGLQKLVEAIVSKLRPKQESKEILDFVINLPDGTQVAVDPPDRDATIRINFSDGSVKSVVYSQSSNV